MVSITLSVPEEVKKQMDEHVEINWSGFVRKSILEKMEELSMTEQLLQQLKEEKDVTAWAVKAQRVLRKGRAEELKKQGLP